MNDTKSKDYLICELTSKKILEDVERNGLESVKARFEDYFVNAQSKAEYEVNIGAYPLEK